MVESNETAVYDVIVIGGVPAGGNVADVAARQNLRVGLIEHGCWERMHLSAEGFHSRTHGLPQIPHLTGRLRRR